MRRTLQKTAHNSLLAFTRSAAKLRAVPFVAQRARLRLLVELLRNGPVLAGFRSGSVPSPILAPAYDGGFLAYPWLVTLGASAGGRTLAIVPQRDSRLIADTLRARGKDATIIDLSERGFDDFVASLPLDQFDELLAYFDAGFDVRTVPSWHAVGEVLASRLRPGGLLAVAFEASARVPARQIAAALGGGKGRAVRWHAATFVGGRGGWRRVSATGPQRLGADIVVTCMSGMKPILRPSDEPRRAHRRAGEKVISVVLGSYNRRRLVEIAIDSVRDDLAGLSHELIVVDGGSTDGTLEWLVSQKDLLTIVQHNRGEFRGRPVERRSWGYFMNLAFKCAQGRYVLMVSDDCVLLPGAIGAAVEAAETVAAAGRRIGGVAFYFRDWPMEERYYVQETISGALMVNHGLFSRRALEDVGWADEDAFEFYKADGDLNLRILQAGYEIVPCEGAFVEHFVDPSESQRMENMQTLQRDRDAYLARWRNALATPAGTDLGIRRIYSDHVDHSGAAAKLFGQAGDPRPER